MVCSCFAVYVLVNNTRFVPYFESCMVALTMYYYHASSSSADHMTADHMTADHMTADHMTAECEQNVIILHAVT